jgi:hypothetical protein
MSALPPKLENWRLELRQSPNAETARQVIAEYFSFFGMEKAKEELWLLTFGTITNDEVEQVKNGRDRADLLFYYEFTGMMMEATRYLHGK